MRQQKTYKKTIWGNFRFATNVYEKYMGSKYHIDDFVCVLLGVIAPFVAMAFPSAAIYVLQNQTELSMALGVILLYVVGMKLLNMTTELFAIRQTMNYFLGRVQSGTPLYTHLLEMDYQSLESKEGQNRSRAANECIYSGNDMGIEAFLMQFPKLLMNTIGFIIYSLLVININIWVFVFMLVSALFLSLLNAKVANYSEKLKGETRSMYIKRVRVFKETMDNQSRGDIILYNMKDWLCHKLDSVRNEYRRYFGKFCKIERNTATWVAVLNLLRDGIVYVVLIGQIRKGLISVSELMLMIGVIAGYSNWMQQIVVGAQKIVINTNTITQFREFLEYGNLEDDEASTKLDVKSAYDIRLENVSFRYEGASKDIISNLNLTIKKGEKMALVGANGSGKTTLVKLITGLYKPSSGKIYIDGIDTATLNRIDQFNAFSVVFQEMRVFACTIAENVSCTLNPDRSKVTESLKKAGIWDKVATFEKGIDAPMTQKLEQDGVSFSGGQNQKLMLARALYQDAPILILDEPTAALDPIAESEMYETYNHFTGDKTSLFISHRLSSTRFCDRVCFLKDGVITEIGSHETLMKNDKDYAEMYKIQAKYYQDTLEDTPLKEAI